MTPLIPKSDFVGLERIAHLCTGGEAPWLRSHDQAAARMGALKSAGMAGRQQLFAVYERAKSRAARMLGVEPARVAFLAHSSEGLNQAVKSVAWRPGDNVVFADLEYPSLIYPAAVLEELGVEPRVVRTRGHYLSLDELAKRVDGRTRLILVSQVSYLTGQRVDLARCAEIARGAGAWLAVDATHALGVAPVPGGLCDFVVSSCYKWLLATHGVGIFAYDSSRVGDIEPATMGWHSVLHRGGFDDPLKMPLRPDASRLGRATRISSVSSSSTMPWASTRASIATPHSSTCSISRASCGRASWSAASPSSRPRHARSARATCASSSLTRRGWQIASPSAVSSCGAEKDGFACRPTSTTTGRTWAGSWRRSTW
jgi:hypothetical protein